MWLHPASDIRSSEITSESVYRNRRDFIKSAVAALDAASAAGLQGCAPSPLAGAAQTQPGRGRFDTDEKVTPYEYATSYNNYYEFGTNKDNPAVYATNFKTKPWTVAVEGMVKNPATYNLEDLIKGLTVEDSIYRMRCDDGWSLVLPWRGFPLADLIRSLEPTPSAKYVEFKTIYAPEQMRGQRRSFLGGGLAWPYVEGLRLDEAMNPLTLIATGIYGKPLPNQNGAPWRLVTPWKYGFKGIKAIVKMRFTDKQPTSSWMDEWPAAYGFYANVNPTVEHPNHSQAREQRI